jgi:hypothetical protein
MKTRRALPNCFHALVICFLTGISCSKPPDGRVYIRATDSLLYCNDKRVNTYAGIQGMQSYVIDGLAAELEEADIKIIHWEDSVKTTLPREAVMQFNPDCPFDFVYKVYYTACRNGFSHYTFRGVKYGETEVSTVSSPVLKEQSGMYYKKFGLCHRIIVRREGIAVVPWPSPFVRLTHIVDSLQILKSKNPRWPEVALIPASAGHQDFSRLEDLLGWISRELSRHGMNGGRHFEIAVDNGIDYQTVITILDIAVRTLENSPPLQAGINVTPFQRSGRIFYTETIDSMTVTLRLLSDQDRSVFTLGRQFSEPRPSLLHGTKLLQYGIESNNLEIVEKAIALGADLNAAIQPEETYLSRWVGYSMLKFSRALGRGEASQLLAERGARDFAETIPYSTVPYGSFARENYQSLDKILDALRDSVEGLADFEQDATIIAGQRGMGMTSVKKIRLTGQGPEWSYQAVVDQNAAAINACYIRELKKSPDLKGQLNLKVSVSDQGRVIAVALTKNTIGQQVAQCITNKIRGWTFRRSEDKKKKTMDVEFVFLK